MRSPHQVMLSILAALVSSSIVLGSLLLSLVEGGYRFAAAPAETVIPTSVLQRPRSTPLVINAAPVGPTDTLTLATLTVTVPVFTPTALPPTPVKCNPPAGWTPLVVQPGDTMTGLARRYAIPVKTLADANCIQASFTIREGIILYVPFVLPSPTPISCGPPYGWVIYIVRYGDNLYQISQAVGVTVYELQHANCLGYSTFIRSGQMLYVPFIPMLVPTVTVTSSATPTILPSNTPTSSTNSTPVPTATPIPTSLPPSTPTSKPSPGITPTSPPPPTATPQPTATSPSINPETTTVPLAPTKTLPPVPTATPGQPGVNPLSPGHNQGLMTTVPSVR
jgi:LysM repeat protein